VLVWGFGHGLRIPDVCSSQNLYAEGRFLHASLMPARRRWSTMDIVSVLLAVIMFAVLLALIYGIERI
jgi:hypothetical protein